MRRRTPLLVILAALVGLPTLASAFDADDVPTVFSIRKSIDENRIDYGIAVDAECHPAGDEPVHAYYRRSNGSTRGLSFLERTVVGTRGQRAQVTEDGGHVSFRVRSLSDRTLVITSRRTPEGCEATVATRVSGEHAVLTDVLAVFDGPRSVDHVELRGRSAGGQLLHENIRP